MNRRKLVRSVVLSISAVAAAVALTAGPAVAGPRPKVGPHQLFEGLVNGKRGVTGPVTIAVGCPGPITPGETGHPLAGQTVEILPAASVGSSSNGNTGGEATEITAFFGPPPPATATAPPAARSTVTFKRYARSKPIPTSIELPCSGTGQVTFVPFPRTPPTSRAAVVPVTYVSPEVSAPH